MLAHAAELADVSAQAVLGSPLTLPSGEVVPNRLVKAAMTEGLADPSGGVSPGLLRLYAEWAKTGCGLLISGNVPVDREHLERPGNVVLAGPPNTETMSGLGEWARTARAGGAGFWMQISHAGRQTPRTVNRRPRAPSAVPLAIPGKQFGSPRALEEPEIEDVIERFVSAALAARDAGFSGVQFHAAHGYLLSQFLSPRANVRRDRYGGSLENRARVLLTIVERARAAVGKGFTLTVKLNSADFQRGGFSAGESTTVAEWLSEAGIDLIEVSGGTYEQPRMMDMDGLEKPDRSGVAETGTREGYFLQFARALPRRVKVPVMVTGGFRSADAMARAIKEDGIALIGLGRPLCVDLDGPRRLLREGGALERSELKVRIGSGILGPESPFKLIKVLNGFGAIYWYYQQLRALARGGAPDRSLGVLSALRRERADQAAWLKTART